MAWRRRGLVGGAALPLTAALAAAALPAALPAVASARPWSTHTHTRARARGTAAPISTAERHTACATAAAGGGTHRSGLKYACRRASLEVMRRRGSYSSMRFSRSRHSGGTCGTSLSRDVVRALRGKLKSRCEAAPRRLNSSSSCRTAHAPLVLRRGERRGERRSSSAAAPTHISGWHAQHGVHPVDLVHLVLAREQRVQARNLKEHAPRTPNVHLRAVVAVCE